MTFPLELGKPNLFYNHVKVQSMQHIQVV
jgi:hypothetical protein